MKNIEASRTPDARLRFSKNPREKTYVKGVFCAEKGVAKIIFNEIPMHKQQKRVLNRLQILQIVVGF